MSPTTNDFTLATPISGSVFGLAVSRGAFCYVCILPFPKKATYYLSTRIGSSRGPICILGGKAAALPATALIAAYFTARTAARYAAHVTTR